MICCTLCDLASYEDAKHMIIQCPYHEAKRSQMYDDITEMCPALEQMIDFSVLMGRYIAGMDLEQMIPIWSISCTYITQMYHDTLNARKE